MDPAIFEASQWVKEARHAIVFDGAGTSVESGIPHFRGEGGLWNTYDPAFLSIDYFTKHPGESWELIREIFYRHFSGTRPNEAHRSIARLWEKGYIKSVITQNIDNLHQRAGTETVLEFHGSSEILVCVLCRNRYRVSDIPMEKLPPICIQCDGVLKPDFIFFGEPVPSGVYEESLREVMKSDLILIIGTSGEVFPACHIPYQGKKNGAKIIEINIESSAYTPEITDIFLRGKATEVMKQLAGRLL